MLEQEKLLYSKKEENQNNDWLSVIGRVIYWQRVWRNLESDNVLYLGRGLICKVKIIQMAHLRYV